MDKKIKIRVSELAMYGQSVIVPNDGEVSIDSDGILEVSEETAKLLLENTSSYVEVGTDGKATTSKDKAVKTTTKAKKVEAVVEEEETEEEETEEEETEEEETEEEETEEETGLTKESLSELEISELIDILKTAKIEKASYAKYVNKKGLLINFILKTIK
jgi:TATA-binding protein-associated factor Taf7